MASTPLRQQTLSPFESPGGRQSPFRRQGSVSPATTTRTATPTTSPTKVASGLSPTKLAALSPEKSSPFVRRPSQINHQRPPERPSSPFGRPLHSLDAPASPTRQAREVASEEMNPMDTVPPLSPARRPVAFPRENDFSRQLAEHSAEPSTFRPPSQSNLRSVMSRATPSPHSAPTRPSPPTSSTPHAHATPTKPGPAGLRSTGGTNPLLGGGGNAAYNHIPQALLHSMRESFEVLDGHNHGAIDAGAVGEMLTQLGLEPSAATLATFFPGQGPPTLNLARYLDTLAGPLAELSAPEELRAAFEAFDLDDSGQIDVGALREALAHSAGGGGGGGGARLRQAEIDGILGEFSSRRAFGAKGLHAAKNKGDVFRYRDFMANVSGGGGGSAAPGAEGEVQVA